MKDASANYLDMLAQAQAAREARGDDVDTDDGSTWSDEVLWTSALDSIDAYARFTGTLTSTLLSETCSRI